MRKQAESYGAQFVFDKVVGADLAAPEKTIYANQGTYTARAVIIATGSMGRGTRIKEKDHLLGKGVSYCATCDGAFFRDKEVVVAGSSDEAIEEALFLTRFASRVHFLSPTPELKAPEEMIDELEKCDKVNLVKGASLSEVLVSPGSKVCVFRNAACRGNPSGGRGVHLPAGRQTDNGFPAGSTGSERGRLPVSGAEYQTAIPGVYAVGDVLCNHIKQAVIAASEGAIAAIALDKNLRGRSKMTVDWAK
jgi:thioredoxin reductase (NADPH)